MNKHKLILLREFYLILRNKRPREIVLNSLLILVLFLSTIYISGAPQMAYGLLFIASFLSLYPPLIFNFDSQVYPKLFTTPLSFLTFVRSKILFTKIVNLVYGIIVLIVVSFFSFQDGVFYIGFILFNTLLTTYITIYLASIKISCINPSKRKQSAFDGYFINNIIAFSLPLFVFIIVALIDIVFDPSNQTIAIALIIISTSHYFLLHKFWENKICNKLMKNKFLMVLQNIYFGKEV